MPNRFISCLQSNFPLSMQKAAKCLLVLVACTTLATSQPSSRPAKLDQKELLTIVQRHEKLLFQYSDNPDKFEIQKLADRIDNIAKAYASFNNNNPKDVFGYVLHGKFLREIGRYPDAYRVFQKAYALDPNLAVVNQQLGNHHSENGRFREAYQHFTKAAKLDPTVPVYHYQLGAHLLYFSKPILAENLLASEEYDKTLMNSLAEAVRLDPQNRSYRTLQAEAYYELKKPDWEAAYKAWSSLLTGSNSEAETQTIQLNQATVLYELKRAPEARLLLSEISLPALSKQKDTLVEKLGGTVQSAKAPASVAAVSNNAKTETANEELLNEIAVLRKELDALKSAPAPKATPSTAPGTDAPEVISLRQEVQRLTKLYEESTKLVESSSQQRELHAKNLAGLEKELEETNKQLKHRETSISAIQKNLKTYASNNADLYKQLQASKKQNEDLQKQISQKLPTPPSNNPQVTQIQAELAQERQTNKTLAEQVATFKAQTEKLRADFQKADKEVKQLSLHLDGQNKQTQAHLAKAQALEQENAELQKRLETSAKPGSPTETSRALAAKEAELSKIKKDMVKLQKSLAAATTNGFSNMTKDIETMAQLARATKERDAKAAELAEVEKKLSEISKANGVLTANTKQFQEDLAKSRTANSLLKEKLDEVLVGSTQLDRQIQNKNKELDIHAQTIKTLKSQLSRTEDLLETKDDSLEKLQKNSDALVIASQKKTEALEKENAGLTNVLKEKEAKHETELAKLQQTLAAQMKKGGQNAETEAKLKLAQKEVKEREGKIDELTKNLSKLNKLIQSEQAQSASMEKQNADLLKEIKVLAKAKKDLNSKDEELEKLEKELSTQTKLVASSKKQSADLVSQLESVKSVHAQEVDKLKKSLAAAQKGSESQMASSQAAESALAKAREELDAKAEEVKKLIKLVDSSGEEKEELLAQLEATKKSHAVELVKLSQSLAAAEKGSEAQMASGKEMESALAKAKKDLDSKDEELEKLTKELSAQAKLVTSSKKQSADLIAELESAKAAHAAEIAKLNKSLAAAEKGSEAQMASSKEMESALAQAKKDLDTTNATHAEEIAKLNKHLETLQKGNELHQTSSKALEDALEKAQKDLVSAKATHADELAKLNKNLVSAQKGSEAQMASSKEMEADLAQAKKDLDSKDKELKALTKLAGTSEKEREELLAQLEVTKKSHVAELVKLTQRLEAAEKSGTAQMAESKAATVELGKVRKDLESKEKELETLTKLSEQSKNEKADLLAQLESAKTAHAAELAKLNIDLQASKKSGESHKETLADLEQAQKDLAVKSTALAELEKKMEVFAKDNKELSALKKNLEDADKTRQTLTVELAGKVEELKEKETANKALQKEYDALSSKLELANKSDTERDQEMDKLEAELAQARKDLEDKGKTLSKVQKDTDSFIKDNQKKIQELEKQNADLLAQVQSRKTDESAELTKLRAELAKAMESGDAQMEKSSEANAELAKIKKELAAKDAEMAKLQNNTDKLEKTLKSTAKEADALSSKLEEEGQMAQQNKKKAEELEKQNSDLLAELKAIKESQEVEIAKIKENLSQASKAGETQLAKSTKAVAELAEAQDDLAEKEATIAEIQKKLDSFDQEKAKILAAQKNAEEELASARSAITQMEKVMDLNDNASKVLTTELVLKIGRIREQEKANKDLQKQLDEVSEQLKVAQRPDNSTTTKELEQLQAELAKVRDNLLEKEKAFAALEKENGTVAASTKGKLESLEKQNADLLKQIENSKSTHSAALAILENALADTTEKFQEAQKANNQVKMVKDPEVKNQLAQAKRDLIAANLQISEKQKAINALLDEKAELSTQLQKHKSLPENTDQEATLLAESNASLQADLNKQKKEIRFLNSELTNLEDKLLERFNSDRQAKQQIETLEQSLQQARETIATLKKPSVVHSPDGQPATNPQMAEELAKQQTLVRLQEKQLAELLDAQSKQASRANAAQASLQETVDRLGRQLTTLESEKETLRSQLTDSNKTVSSLKEQLAGNPYATLPTAPLARTAPDQDLQVKLDLAKANEEELRARLEQTNEQKLKLSEQLVLTENTLSRTKAQLADSQKQVLNRDVSSPQEAQLKEQLKELETAFATYRASTQEDFQKLQVKLAQANSSPAPSSGPQLQALRNRLQDLIASSTKTKETLTRIHSALSDANRQNSDLEAELIRQKQANQKLRQQFNHFPETRSLLAVDTLATPIEDDSRVRKLEIALQKTQTKLDEREKQFENVVSRMNLLIQRLKQPR